MRRFALIFKDNDFQLRPEDELMLCCARTHINEAIEDKIISLVSKDLDWEYLIDMAAKHRLRPLLYVNLNAVCGEDVPEDVLGDLKSFYMANVQKNLMLTGELVQILNLLYSSEIKAIPYKGPAISLLAYNDLSLRTFNDLDIFIKKSDALKILEILFSKGYQSVFKFSPKNEISFYKSQKGIVVFNKDLSLSLDLQWRVSGNFFSYKNKPESLIWRDELINLKNNIEFSTFSKEKTLLIQSIHAAGHQWSRLIWLCDISELIRKSELDWDEILDKTSNLGIERILNINLILINELFGTQIPEKISKKVYSDELAQKLSVDIINDIFSDHSNSEKILYWAFFHLKIRENLIDGIIDSIKHATIPSIEELAKLRLPNKLYPIYYIFKPFHLIFRYKL